MAKKNITVDELAVMTARGFQDIGQRIDGIDGGFVDLKNIMKLTLEELTTTHADVRHIRSTVDRLTHSDIAHEAAINHLTARVQRLEQKVGLTK